MSASPVEYNGTIPTGGDSLTEDLNIFYSVRDHVFSFITPTTAFSSPTNEERLFRPDFLSFCIDSKLTRALGGRCRMATSPGS